MAENWKKLPYQSIPGVAEGVEWNGWEPPAYQKGQGRGCDSSVWYGVKIGLTQMLVLPLESLQAH